MNRKKTSKIKKLHLPLKKMTTKDKDYVAVLLEDVNHNFKIFGEELGSVKKELGEEIGSVKKELGEEIGSIRKKGEATFEEVGRIKEKLTGIEKDIKEIKQEIISIKNEIKELKLALSKKADLERLEALELRVARIEKYLKLST